MTNSTGTISADLAAALVTFRRFLLADDFDRSREIGGADPETLEALAAAVEPLFDEINAVLDRLTGARHPLPPNEEDLEADLNSLAQAGVEARLGLTS